MAEVRADGAGVVNVGIVGVGNCASSLVQGVRYYAGAGPDAPGLQHAVLGGYRVADVRFTAAFDVHAGKVGRDLADAIWAEPNNALRFADVPPLGVEVADGVLADGVGESTSGHVDARGEAGVEDVARRLRDTGTHVLVNFLPVGAQHAAEVYAEAALRAGCGYVNCMPAVVARAPEWAERFAAAGLPLAGDDLKSQFGATAVHRALLDVLARNGVRLRSTYQLLAGGNMDFLNMQDADRMLTKKATKAQGMGAASGHVGADYIPYLEDSKIAHIRIDADAFGGTPFEIDVRMKVEDSPSAAGKVLDAVRYLKAAMDRGVGGVVDPVSAELMKAPRTALPEEKIRKGLAELG